MNYKLNNTFILNGSFLNITKERQDKGTEKDVPLYMATLQLSDNQIIPVQVWGDIRRNKIEEQLNKELAIALNLCGSYFKNEETGKEYKQAIVRFKGFIF